MRPIFNAYKNAISGIADFYNPQASEDYLSKSFFSQVIVFCNLCTEQIMGDLIVELMYHDGSWHIYFVHPDHSESKYMNFAEKSIETDIKELHNTLSVLFLQTM